MGTRVALTHHTTYRYEPSVSLGPQTVRLRPAPHSPSPVVDYALRIRPEEHSVHWQQDLWSNHLARIDFRRPTDRLELRVDLVADLVVVNPFDFFLEEEVATYPFVYPETWRPHLSSFLDAPDRGPRFAAYLAEIDRRPQRSVEFLVGLNRKLARDLSYAVRHDPGFRSPEQTLAEGGGACRDFAWLEVQLLRHLGLAARFVSGYALQLAVEDQPLDDSGEVVRDGATFHAWSEVYLPGAGWIGLDPTSGLLAGGEYIPLACAPGPEDAAPVSGKIGACESRFEVEIAVERL